MLNDSNSDAFGKEQTMLEAVLALNARRGWALFPAPADGAKKSHKSKKHSNGRNWGATRDPNEIRRDFTRWPDANLGAPAGIENGFFVVEADTQEGHGIDGIATIRQLEAEYGPLPDTLMGASPSGSVHRFFKYPNKDGVTNSQSKVGPGIDVIGEGGMVLLPPSTRPGRGQYRWLNDLDEIAEAPQWLLELITNKIRKKTSTHSPLPDWMQQYVSVEEPEGLPPGTGRGFSDDSKDYLFDEIAAAAQVIPNNDVPWEKWNHMGMALYAATGGNDEGLAIFHEYSKKSKKYDEEDTNAKWQALHSSPPDQIGIGSIFQWANEADPSWRTNYNKQQAKAEAEAEAEFRFEEAASESKSSEDSAQGNSESKPDESNTSDDAKPKLVLTLAEWAARDLPKPDFIMGNWLTTTSRVLIFAETGLGKTLHAMAISMAAAGGKEFLHWRGVRPIKVLYIDGEMSRRLLKQRLADEALRLGVAPETFYALNREDLPDLQPLNTLAGQKQIEHVIRTYCGGKVDLIVFDNVMALIAGDQKDEEGWRAVLPWTRRLTQFAIGQIWIHHTGHDATRSYGTKTREWGMDTVIGLEKVERPDTDVSFRLFFQKARERTPETRADFADVKIALVGNRWVGETTARVNRVSPNAKKFFEVLCSVCDQELYGRPAATLEAWQEACLGRGLLDSGMPRRGGTLFGKYRRELIIAGWITCNETHVWVMLPNPRSEVF